LELQILYLELEVLSQVFSEQMLPRLVDFLDRPCHKHKAKHLEVTNRPPFLLSGNSNLLEGSLGCLQHHRLNHLCLAQISHLTRQQSKGQVHYSEELKDKALLVLLNNLLSHHYSVALVNSSSQVVKLACLVVLLNQLVNLVCSVVSPLLLLQVLEQAAVAYLASPRQAVFSVLELQLLLLQVALSVHFSVVPALLEDNLRQEVFLVLQGPHSQEVYLEEAPG
jgi:hypothetical protein